MEMKSWNVSGSYYEVCNCEAICPCRRQDGKKGGKATYDTCDFALSWAIEKGAADATDLTGLKVVMAGTFDRENDGAWKVMLYIDDQATPAQRDALEAVFLGKTGASGEIGFTANIAEIESVKSARIELDHTRAKERIGIVPVLSVKTREAVTHDFTVSCGIPGHDFPGQEIIADHVVLHDGPWDWEFRGKCGFATRFAYAST